MSFSVTQEDFDSLASGCENPDDCLRWNMVFTLPVWLKVWCKEFKPDADLYLGTVRQDNDIIGFAPLLLKDGGASFMGNTDVCDYLDFVIAPGHENDFYSTLIDDLKQKGTSYLDLHALRPDSAVLTSLVDYAKGKGYETVCQPEDVSVEMELPATWEEYLDSLKSKQRHEVKRKLRRLMEAGEVEYSVLETAEDTSKAMDTFFEMFTRSRSDKANFLTEEMKTFFRSLVETLAGAGLLKIGTLTLDARPVAMIVFFDYNDSIYLYNSGYDPDMESLSVGLLSKVFSIQESIRQGKKKYDFLKGNEIYKYRLGGIEVPLESCRINIQ